MILTHLVAFTIIFIKFSCCGWQNNDDYAFRLKSIKCQADNVTLIFKYCYLKAYSRKLVTANIGNKFLVPYNHFYFQFIFYYRYGTIFRMIVDSKQHEWCELMRHEITNPVIKYVFDGLKGTMAAAFKKCPFTGELDFYNVTIDSNILGQESMIVPQGTYRVQVLLTTNNTQTAKVSVEIDVKSPHKDSFG